MFTFTSLPQQPHILHLPAMQLCLLDKLSSSLPFLLLLQKEVWWNPPAWAYI